MDSLSVTNEQSSACDATWTSTSNESMVLTSNLRFFNHENNKLDQNWRGSFKSFWALYLSFFVHIMELENQPSEHNSSKFNYLNILQASELLYSSTSAGTWLYDTERNHITTWWLHSTWTFFSCSPVSNFSCLVFSIKKKLVFQSGKKHHSLNMNPTS
jgi:hypothetical protein